MQCLALYGRHEQNLMKREPRSSSNRQGQEAFDRIDAFPRAPDARLLLRLADAWHAFVGQPAAETTLRDVELALPFPQVTTSTPRFRASREASGLGRRQGRGGHRVAADFPEEPGRRPRRSAAEGHRR